MSSSYESYQRRRDIARRNSDAAMAACSVGLPKWNCKLSGYHSLSGRLETREYVIDAVDAESAAKTARSYRPAIRNPDVIVTPVIEEVTT